MFKNVASQKVALFAFDTTTGAAKTGDAANITGYVNKDWAAVTVLGTAAPTELSATNAPGWYVFTLTQAETNANQLHFTAKSSTSNVSVVGLQFESTPPNFPALGINAGGGVLCQSGLKKNVAKLIPFWMTDSTTHNAATGKTCTVTRSIDGGAFTAGTVSGITEVANGLYYASFAAADLNGDVINILVTASGADATPITLFMEP